MGYEWLDCGFPWVINGFWWVLDLGEFVDSVWVNWVRIAIYIFSAGMAGREAGGGDGEGEARGLVWRAHSSDLRVAQWSRKSG